ncbi:MAG: carbon-nitrogen family hydrolase [Nitrospirae bacterium]|nr:carbon-nitrogen family hydrolase [Nitrospirota bacterium]
MRIALVQMSIEDGDAPRNLRHAEELTSGAPPADLYMLPELWTTGYAHEAWDRVAEDETLRVCASLQQRSRDLGAWIAGSMITRTPDGSLVNRLWLFGPEGSEPISYDKGHLFGPMGEKKYLVPGARRISRPLGEWTAALSICFDLRFPEMYRRDAVDGADLFLVVAEWPHPRCEVLQTLVRARAVENQAYLALCNRIGLARDGTRFCGGSVIVGPDGRIVVDAGQEEGVYVGEVEHALVTRVRAELPVLDQRMAGLDW